MPSLSDQTSNPISWGKMSLIAAGLVVVVGLVVASWWAHHHYVEKPQVLAKRFEEPPGDHGLASGRVALLGADAVPTLLQDLNASDTGKRAKALELLAAVRDLDARPQVIDGLGREIGRAHV